MSISHQLLFFFSALGAFNGVLLSAYLFGFARSRQSANFFLGCLLTMLSIRVWKSVFFYFHPDLSRMYLQIGLSACFFIGPFLYFFVRSKLQSESLRNPLTFAHLAALIGVVVVVGILYPYKMQPDLWGDLFYKLINYQWLLYILASGWLLKSVFKKAFNRKDKLTYDEVWILSVFTGVFLIWMAYYLASFTSYITGALSFSFVLYLSVLLMYFKRKKEFVVAVKKDKYAGQKIEEAQAQAMLLSIDEVIIGKQLFKDPNLTLSQLAKEISVRPHVLSQLLNDNVEKSFSLFVNEYRVREAQQLLLTKNNLKMEVIAERCGFNSKSTFYTAFKKIAHTTPGQYALRQRV